jgi:hypothetical protein
LRSAPAALAPPPPSSSAPAHASPEGPSSPCGHARAAEPASPPRLPAPANALAVGCSHPCEHALAVAPTSPPPPRLPAPAHAVTAGLVFPGEHALAAARTTSLPSLRSLLAATSASPADPMSPPPHVGTHSLRSSSLLSEALREGADGKSCGGSGTGGVHAGPAGFSGFVKCSVGPVAAAAPPSHRCCTRPSPPGRARLCSSPGALSGVAGLACALPPFPSPYATLVPNPLAAPSLGLFSPPFSLPTSTSTTSTSLGALGALSSVCSLPARPGVECTEAPPLSVSPLHASLADARLPHAALPFIGTSNHPSSASAEHSGVSSRGSPLG